MNLNRLAAKVAEAVALDRQIAELEETLKNLKAELVKAAESDLMDKVVTDGGGWSVELQGTDGCIARVTQPGAKLKSSIDGESATWLKIKEILQDRFRPFFNGEVKYKPVAEFRKQAAALLSSSDERKIIKLMTVNSSPAVSFETKESAS